MSLDPWDGGVCSRCAGSGQEMVTRNYLAEALRIAGNPECTVPVERAHLVAIVQYCRQVVSAVVCYPKSAKRPRQSVSKKSFETQPRSLDHTKSFRSKGEKGMLISARNGHEAESAQQPVARPTAAQDRSVSRNEPQTNHNAIARPASLEFRRAVKHDAKMRFAICGPSGSGKTYTLLQARNRTRGPVALIDTERGSASKYADLFEFDVLELESLRPGATDPDHRYGRRRGIPRLCIDSLSHFWMGKDGELDKVDGPRKADAEPNSFAAWKRGNSLAQRIDRQA